MQAVCHKTVRHGPEVRLINSNGSNSRRPAAIGIRQVPLPGKAMVGLAGDLKVRLCKAVQDSFTRIESSKRREKRQSWLLVSSGTENGAMAEATETTVEMTVAMIVETVVGIMDEIGTGTATGTEIVSGTETVATTKGDETAVMQIGDQETQTIVALTAGAMVSEIGKAQAAETQEEVAETK